MEKKARILVAEDEERSMRLMEDMLTAMGYEPVLARDGEQALEKVAQAPPDVMLVDVMMPGMDGFEVARRVKQNEETKIIPLVIVTALREVEDRVKAIEAGADDFLTKPVDKCELEARLRSLLKVKALNDHMRDHRRELEGQVEQRTDQLRRAFERTKSASLETILRLCRAAEYKDEDTGAHIQRMSRYAAAIARKMGLTDRAVETILYAAPMHDIGKLGIPDEILLKPAKLDREEWKTMKQHTVMGGKILEGSGSGFIKLGREIALTHHERWDGKGYPNGLKATAIPLAGRAAAAADVFDALTSARPYRKQPFAVERAFRTVQRGSGTRFDPAIVEAFFALKDEIIAIKDTYTDEGVSPLITMNGLKHL